MSDVAILPFFPGSHDILNKYAAGLFAVRNTGGGPARRRSHPAARHELPDRCDPAARWRYSSMANQEFIGRRGGSIRTNLIPGCAIDDATEKTVSAFIAASRAIADRPDQLRQSGRTLNV